MAVLIPSPKNGDWTSLRSAIRKLASLKLGTSSKPTFAGLTLSDSFHLSYLTEGSVLFAGTGGLISQDNTNLSWNDATDTLTVTNIAAGVSLTVNTTDFVVDTVNHIVEIGSVDGSDKIQLYHDNSNAYCKWNDGYLALQTDEGENANTSVRIMGKGLGRAELRVFGPGDTEEVAITCQDNKGYVHVDGEAPGELRIQHLAKGNVVLFSSAAEGETKELQIYGYRTGDASRSLQIGVGVDAADTASFDGLSNYRFDGNVDVEGTCRVKRILAGSIT